MAIVRCVLCTELVVVTKESLKRHSARYHNYASDHYEEHKPHHAPLSYPCMVPGCAEEKAKIVAKGEERLGLQHFFGVADQRHMPLPEHLKPVVEALDIKYYHGPDEPVK